MSNKAADNPQKIVLLAGATVIALGVAGWQVVKAMQPPTPTVTVSVVPSAAGAAKTDGSDLTANSRDSSHTEAVLAMNADPFYPRLTPPAAVRITAPTQPGGNTAISPGPTPPPLPPVIGPVFGAPPQAVRKPVPPVLLGTLLGEKSSAVFRDGQGVKIVPVGQKYGAWRVVSVDHGDAILRTDHFTVRLAVGDSGREKDKLTVGGSSSAHPISALEITVRAADPVHDPAESMQTMASTPPMRAPDEMTDPFRNPEAPVEAPQPSELEKPAPPPAHGDGPAAPEAPRMPTE